MELYELHVNHLDQPLGYQMDKTVFSWKVREAEGREKDARIRVGKTPDLSEETLLIDTGYTETLDSAGTELKLSLEPRTRYYWDVTVRTDRNEARGEVQWFETGKMDEAWSGKWISCENAEERHPVFFKKLTLSTEVKQARLYICGLGLYEADIDGQRVGEEYLAPYCTDYNEWVQLQTYDVTALLKKDSVLSVTLGKGWYKGRFGFATAEDSTWYGSEWKLIAELHVSCTDGRNEVIGTDESWMVKRSNITFSNIYDGEHCDDTLPSLPFEKSFLCDGPIGKLCDRLSTPVKVHEQFKAAEVIHTPAGETVLDMGQEFTGIFSLRVHAPKGQVITVQTGEVLQEGNFYRENLRTAKSEYIYVSDGTEKFIRPHFTFYGYRYVKIEGIPDLKADDFTGLALYSEIPDSMEIRTGHTLLNQLLSNVRWGMKCNFLDVPTDCPQRDERMGWTGDAQIFCATAMYLADTWSFYRKYLYDMSLEQKSRGGKVPQVIPNFGKEGTSSVWGDAACIIPWNLYEMYGDKSILELQFDSMRAWVDYIRSADGESHEWRNEFHYGDWLALDHPLGGEFGFLGGTDERFVADVSYLVSIGIVKKAAAVLKKEEEEKEYEELEEKQLEWIRKEYYTATGKCCIRTQTAQLLTLKYGLSTCPEEAKKTLCTLLDESRGKLKTGFVGTPLLCPVLSDSGLDSMAWDLLLNEEYPGWLNEVRLGATTIWERWNSLDQNGKITGTQMNSMNHYASGAVAEWVFRYAAGINAASAGFRHICFAPRIDKRIGKLEASFESAFGRICSAWEYLDDTHVKVSFTVPFGTAAEAYLPQAKEEVYRDTQNPMFADVRDGICHLEPGSYSVEYAIPASTMTYSVDTSMRQLLANEAVRGFIGSLIPLEQLPEEFMPLSFRKLAMQFGEAAEEQLLQIDAALKQF